MKDSYFYILFFTFLFTLVESACKDYKTCAECTNPSNLKSLGHYCRWCPLDNQCHAMGSSSNHCEGSQNILLPEGCPDTPKSSQPSSQQELWRTKPENLVSKDLRLKVQEYSRWSTLVRTNLRLKPYEKEAMQSFCKYVSQLTLTFLMLSSPDILKKVESAKQREGGEAHLATLRSYLPQASLSNLNQFSTSVYKINQDIMEPSMRGAALVHPRSPTRRWESVLPEDWAVAMVQEEQRFIEQTIQQGGLSEANIKVITALLNLPSIGRVEESMAWVRGAFGRDLDYGKQQDREAIGIALCYQNLGLSKEQYVERMGSLKMRTEL